MSAEHSMVLSSGTELQTLFVHLDRLDGGEEQVEEFSTWYFQNAAWEDTSSDDILVDLGFGITSILYQWQDFAPRVTAADLVREIDAELGQAGVIRQSPGRSPFLLRIDGGKTSEPAPESALPPAQGSSRRSHLTIVKELPSND